ncbi:MAG: PilZ domain-containing protein [Deltaproteobacteria bacterium]|nr:PilZ domain-containing protein [Deltaproteobacteria bacterium]
MTDTMPHTSTDFRADSIIDDLDAERDLIERGIIAEEEDEPAWVSEMPLPPIPLIDSDEITDCNELTLAPERIRFAVPLTVETQVALTTADGVIINLSESGLACILPLVLSKGERLRCRFRPALGEERLNVFAEIVWQRTAGGDDIQYGMKFLHLNDSEQQRISSIVRERVEGKAGEWPLPVMPATIMSAPPPASATTAMSAIAPHRFSPYVAGILGVAAGVLISVFASLLPSFAFDGTAQPLESALTPVSASMQEDTINVEAKVSDAKPSIANKALADKPATTLLATASPLATKGAVESKTISEQLPRSITGAGSKLFTSDKITVANKVITPETKTKTVVSPKVIEKVKTVNPAAKSHFAKAAITNAKLSAQFTLRVDKAVNTYKKFWLDNPRRLVIDIPGASHALDGREIKVKSPLVANIVSGVHSDKIRFVFYMLENNGVEASVQPQGQKILVSLYKQ